MGQRPQEVRNVQSYYEGVISDAESVLELHQKETVTTFGIRRNKENKNPAETKVCTVAINMFMSIIAKLRNHKKYWCFQTFCIEIKIFWKQSFGNTAIEFGGIPFRPIQTRRYDCHYYKKRERKSTRLCLQSTRKIGCPAHMVVKEYHLYPNPFGLTHRHDQTWRRLSVCYLNFSTKCT